MTNNPSPPLGLCGEALNALADAVCITDADGLALHVNASFERVTGFSEADILGLPYLVMLSTARSADESAQLGSTLAEFGTWEGEFELRRKDGAAFIARCTVSRMPSGTLVHHFRDVTAYRRDAEAARRSILGFRALIEQSPDGIAVHREGRFVYANHAFASCLGFEKADDLAGSPLLDRVHPADHAALQEMAVRVGTAASEQRLLRKDGSTMYAELWALPVVFDGLPANVIIARDLTQTRAMELCMREMDRMVSIGTLAAGIAHEINTPVQFVGDSVHFLQGALADVFGLVEKYRGLRDAAAAAGWGTQTVAGIVNAEDVIDLPYLEEHCPKAIARALEGVSRVAGIVRAMKEFGHPGTAEMAAADLNNAIQNTLTVARNEWKYVADVETDLGDLPLVHCHLGSLNQVFLNLIVNASHAIGDLVRDTERKGTIRITSSVSAGMVRIAVSDDGTGIPESARARIFDPFFTTKEVGKGTGQGLAIARSIVVEKHGGALRFQTEIGKGTTFFLDIPIEGPPQ